MFKVTNKLQRIHTRQRQYAPGSINDGHIMIFVKVTYLILSLDEEILVLLVPV